MAAIAKNKISSNKWIVTCHVWLGLDVDNYILFIPYLLTLYFTLASTQEGDVSWGEGRKKRRSLEYYWQKRH
jgi:hypothetical protein